MINIFASHLSYSVHLTACAFVRGRRVHACDVCPARVSPVSLRVFKMFTFQSWLVGHRIRSKLTNSDNLCFPFHKGFMNTSFRCGSTSGLHSEYDTLTFKCGECKMTVNTVIDCHSEFQHRRKGQPKWNVPQVESSTGCITVKLCLLWSNAYIFRKCLWLTDDLRRVS